MLRKVFTLSGVVVAVSEIGSIDADVTHPKTAEFQILDNSPEFVAPGYTFDGTTYSAPIPTPEQIAANQEAAAKAAREALKAQRTAAVAQIKVTTAAGNTFDGDEVSQGRMSRAIIALSTGLAPSVTWVLADNSVIQATAAELTEALVLAGQAQAAIWVIA